MSTQYTTKVEDWNLNWIAHHRSFQNYILQAVEHECLLLPVQVDPSVQSSSKTVSNSTTPVPGDKSNRLLGMFKFEVPRPPSGGTRSICDELNDYMDEAETDFRRLWINPKFANFKIRRLARKIFATTATSAPS